MATLLHRLGLFAVRRRWIVTGLWLLALVTVGIFVRTLGAETSNNLDLPGADSQKASNLLAERFPPQQNGKNPVVFHLRSGKVTDPRPKQAIGDSQAAIRKLDRVHSAPSPFGQAGAAQISDDERTAFIPVLLNVGNDELDEDFARRILDAAAPARRAGMDVAAGGQVGSVLSQPATESSELVGLTVAMMILALTFGSLVAMGLPILSAVIGLLIGLSLIGLLGHVASVPDIGPTLATMIGLGVGIDYALFLLSRYRSLRDEGHPIEEAIAAAVATSGSAIVFAGSTVIAALLILVLAGIPLVTSLGYAAAVAVITAALAAITLLPAILAILGSRFDALRLPGFRKRGRKPEAGKNAVANGVWARWGRFTVAHPRVCVPAVLIVLLVLAVPTLSLDLGQEDVGATPTSTVERRAYDMMATGFGVGYNGPLLIAARLGSPATPSNTYESQMRQARQLQQKLEDEQAEGQTQEAQLSRQASTLTQRQAELEAEGAALESQAEGLVATRSQIEAEREALVEQLTLREQLEGLGAQARELAGDEARLAAETAATGRELEAVRTAQAEVERRVARQPGPLRRAALERRLVGLDSREAKLSTTLEAAAIKRGALQREAAGVATAATALHDQAAGMGEQARILAAQAATAAQEADSMFDRKSTLEQEAASAEVEAANLQAQKAQLEAMQQVAQMQEEQAESLKSELTAEMTKAGGDARGTDPRLVKLQNGLTRAIGVDLVSPPQINAKGDAAIFTVIAATRPADPKTADLVVALRNFVIPQQTAGEDVNAHVGGQTASYVDLASAISARLMLVILAVIALGFLVLMTAFHSLLVPAQAALANLLSVGAAFGILTAVFQFGWGLNLVGLDTAAGTDPIASFVPLIMFAVLFGLSMDYQVFLISEIQQQRREKPASASNSEAIAAGVAKGARVIGAAALIMVAVFASFLLNGDPTVKQFGVGLSAGVALAAISVLVFSPAILVIAGSASWWIPDGLRRLLPSIDIEGAGSTESAESALRRVGRAVGSESRQK